MWEHSRDCHAGQLGARSGIGDYGFKVSGRFRKYLSRQIGEGLRITATELEDITPEFKNEFFTS